MFTLLKLSDICRPVAHIDTCEVCRTKHRCFIQNCSNETPCSQECDDVLFDRRFEIQCAEHEQEMAFIEQFHAGRLQTYDEIKKEKTVLHSVGNSVQQKENIFSYLTVISNPCMNMYEKNRAAGDLTCNFGDRCVSIRQLFDDICEETEYSQICEVFELNLASRVQRISRLLPDVEADALLLFSGYKDADLDAMYSEAREARNEAYDALYN